MWWYVYFIAKVQQINNSTQLDLMAVGLSFFCWQWFKYKFMGREPTLCFGTTVADTLAPNLYLSCWTFNNSTRPDWNQPRHHDLANVRQKIAKQFHFNDAHWFEPNSFPPSLLCTIAVCLDTHIGYRSLTFMFAAQTLKQTMTKYNLRENSPWQYKDSHYLTSESIAVASLRG